MEQGAHLVDIDSLDESNFIVDLVDGSVDYFWIGLNDLKTEGHFVRSDGNAPSFLNWLRGEPNDHYYYYYREDCVQVRMGYSSGKPFNGWDDMNCNAYRAFVCEKEEGKLFYFKPCSTEHIF